MNKLLLSTAVAACFCVCLPSAWAADIPQSIRLQYGSNYGIPAVMTFKRDGERYTVQADINVPMYRMRFESGGKINGKQLWPEYYRDIRNGKTYASAQFTVGKATYTHAGNSQTENISGRVMDLFTLSWQLALNNGRIPDKLYITNGKKIYRAGSIIGFEIKSFKINGKNTKIHQFTLQRDDDVVHYAFAPALNNVPALIRYSDGGQHYHLILRSVSINGVPVKPQAAE